MKGHPAVPSMFLLSVLGASACVPGPSLSTVTGPPAPANTQASSPSPVAAGLATYRSAAFGVTLQYPANWKANVKYTGRAKDPRYEGDDGFLMVDAISALSGVSLDQIAESHANHKLKPYGDNPDIVTMRVGGQEARLIMPRDEKTREAALIARYPQPLQAGEQFFGLYADKAHIEQIAATIQFQSPTH